MASHPEITNLFATLASHLETLNQNPPIGRGGGAERSLDTAISELNLSLNIDHGDDSAVKFLDAALSILCFKAPQVFDSVTEHLVEAIATALSSSIRCKVFKFQNRESFEIGSSISRGECFEVMKACGDILAKLKENHVSGKLSDLLLHAVIQIAVSASCYQNLFPFYPVLDAKSVKCQCFAASMLLSHLPTDVCLKDHNAPLRLLLWYLDPLILKRDFTKILQETIERPFLCLCKEFHQRSEWNMILLCLVFSPAMFYETRALLHKWFLKTGMDSILEFMIALVSMILDLISRPTFWGISMVTGLKLPFSFAYFPSKHHVFCILAGPTSSANLLNLVHSVGKMKADAEVEKIDHKSLWSVAINFPNWYYYATLLLFSDGPFEDIHTFGSPTKVEQTPAMKQLSCSNAASWYIAWILCPISQRIQENIVNCLNKVSRSWISKSFDLDGQDKITVSSRKKLKKPKFCDVTNDSVLGGKCQNIGIWLENFDKMYKLCFSQIASSTIPSQELESSLSRGLLQDLMFRRIPLGILVGWSGDLSEGGYELLLHYATTGRILGLGNLKSLIWSDENNQEEAVTGASLIFSLTDIVENMSQSLFEIEESGLNFILRFKERTSRYLVKCIKKLIQLKAYEDGSVMLSDLHCRLLQWKHQGRDYVDTPQSFKDVLCELKSGISTR